MSKKKKQPTQQSKTKTSAAAENYYKLNTDAVERLADASNAPEVSDAEINKYKSGGKHKIPSWLKILFLKFWFSGAICYFFLWGLGVYLKGLDMVVAVSVGMGVVTDLIVNHFLRSLEPEQRAYDKWMMVTVRKWWSMILNVFYAGLILFCIMQTYVAINTLLYGPSETSENILGVEPLLFGILYVAFDMLFIAIKNGFIKIFRDAEKKVSSGKK